MVKREQVINRKQSVEETTVIERPPEKLVKVRARGHICEGVYYKPGDEWETTSERARALGGQVENV